MREPDVTRFIAMVAFAALATTAELAAVVSLPVGWVLAATLLPVIFWALLWREVYRLLKFTGDAEAPDAAGPSEPSGPRDA